MNIPKMINVMGTKVTIKKIKKWDGHKDVPENLVGRYYPDSQTIYINSKWPKVTQERFLLHELNHALMHIVGIDQNMGLDLQEVIAQSFASFYKDLV